MAIKITDECINCDACIAECPNNAIYEPDTEWTYAEGTALKGTVAALGSGSKVDKCTECKGFHDEPQCASVCPVDCCIPDGDHKETEAELLAKKAWMHGE